MTEASPVHLSRRTTFGVAAAGAALAAATFSGTSSLRAQTRGKGTFVLVHPAWFGGWCWKKVAPLLRARGYDVYTPTLTGLGDRAHLARPEIGLNIHIEDVANLLKYEDLTGVVLVGNSSGGMVITGVADQAPELIAHVVYLDAFVPQDGQSMLDIMPPDRRPPMEALVRNEGQGWLLPRFAPPPWGFTNYEFSMGGKWLEILKEITASVTHVAVIFNPDNPALLGQLRSIEAAGPAFRIQVNAKPARNAEAIEQIIRAFAAEANGGLLVLLDFVTLAHRDLIIKLAAEYGLPAVYTLRIFPTGGGLISYGVDSADLFRRGASYIDRILKGAKPADLPVQAPTKFELVINLKTAKALGLDLPLTLLARADEVIE